MKSHLCPSPILNIVGELCSVPQNSFRNTDIYLVFRMVRQVSGDKWRRMSPNVTWSRQRSRWVTQRPTPTRYSAKNETCLPVRVMTDHNTSSHLSEQPCLPHYSSIMGYTPLVNVCPVLCFLRVFKSVLWFLWTLTSLRHDKYWQKHTLSYF